MFVAVGALALVGAAAAQGGMGMHGGMGMMGGDDKVTKDEFLERAEARFARMDFNKDGVIDASDRQQMRQRMHECREMMGGMGMMDGHRMMDQGSQEAAPPPKP
jgi:NAD(P)H-dependent flavin oxidoreductase YrpB (nitropropane dioxygenase family)